MYLWQRQAWPNFTWNDAELLEPLSKARLHQGRLLGSMAQLGFLPSLESQVEAQTEEVVRSSSIEGETLSRPAVRSSVARRLGLPEAAAAPVDRRIDGVVAMMLDATGNLAEPLTAERLFGWQAALFPTGYADLTPVRTGGWRDDARGPMQVVSGPPDRLRVHYEAPPAERIDGEMQRFLEWFNRRSQPEGLLRAAIAHLWFVTIHPFEDGNGRVARALADRALAQSEGSSQRFYSMSRQIQAEVADYYAVLEQTQKGTEDITRWLHWFLCCFTRAVDNASSLSGGVMRKHRFWRLHQEAAVSERQRKVLNRYLDGFEGNLTAKKWAARARCSVPTAQRDINDLIERGILSRNPGGSKNTSYLPVEP